MKINNMREIKFRAWDKENKTMIYPENKENNQVAKIILNAWCDSENDRVILMQYTGLKDKNGKEVFEGDIVRAELYKGENVFIVEWESIANHSAFGAGTHNLTVIGNIYENKELLDERA